MSLWLRQSTARTVVMGPFVDAVDGSSAEIALDITEQEVLLSKNGGAFTLKSETTHGVHDEAHNGWYTILLNTTDTATLGLLVIAINMAGARPVWAEFQVVPTQVWDSFLGSDLLQVDATQWLGTAITAGSIPAAVAGAAGGVFIAGTNAATTITTALGSALTLASTGANGSGLLLTGNGSGDGIEATGGATGAGMHLVGGATSGAGLSAAASGANNYAIEAAGTGATDSGGIKMTASTAGEGFEARAAGNGHGMLVVGAGTGEGLHSTGGTGSSGDGAKFEGGGNASASGIRVTGGTGGKGVNIDTITVSGAVAFDLTGNVSGSVGSVGNIAPTGTGLTAIPWNATWDAEVQSEAQDAITASGLATAAALTVVDDFLDTEIAAILADTNELQTDWANGGRLDVILDAAGTPSAATIADAVWDEATSGHGTAGTTGKALTTAAAAAIAAGAGSTSETITVNDGTSPLDGVAVWITTDSGGTTIVASGVTDALGHVTFMLDAGSYYCWKQRSGVNFTNPEALTVA